MVSLFIIKNSGRDVPAGRLENANGPGQGPLSIAWELGPAVGLLVLFGIASVVIVVRSLYILPEPVFIQTESEA